MSYAISFCMKNKFIIHAQLPCDMNVSWKKMLLSLYDAQNLIQLYNMNISHDINIVIKYVIDISYNLMLIIKSLKLSKRS